jgi:hypothetical protein
MATLHQGLGHFGQWGGSAITVHSPSARLYGLVWGLWANLLAGSWIDAPPLRWLVAPIVLLLLALGAHRAFPLRASFRAQPELVLSMLAYFVWALLGQNTAGKPRHWLPLLLLLLLTIAAGADALLARHRAALAAPLLLAAAWLFDGAQLVDAHRDPSPVAAAARFLAEGSGRDQRPVIAGDAARLYAEGAPRRAVRWASGEAALVQLVTEAGEGGALLSSEALSPALRGELTRRGFTLTLAFSRPRSRYVDSLWYELALFEARPAALR